MTNLASCDFFERVVSQYFPIYSFRFQNRNAGIYDSIGVLSERSFKGTIYTHVDQLRDCTRYKRRRDVQLPWTNVFSSSFAFDH